MNPLTILGLLSGGAPPAQVQQAPAQRPPADDRLARFVSTVLADTEDVWAGVFSQGGARYQEPRLVLFRGATRHRLRHRRSGHGAVVYCPADQKVYIDLGFYETLKHQLGAPGEFAQAYVIAHEVGHHVQNLLGISDKVDSQRGRISQVQYNQLSVRLELQADCFAVCLGAPCPDGAANSGKRRHRGRHERCGQDRRRRPATAKPGPRGAREFYPRLQRTARALVQQRPATRQRAALRHVFLRAACRLLPSAAAHASFW